jgi:membrane protein implicated in regulation of membrane protease activity
MTVVYWLGAAGFFLLAEIFTLGLTSIWFAGGAAVGALMAALKLPIYAQIGAFVVVSIVLLVLTRPLAQKYLNSKTVRTNAESLIGETGIVTESIDNLYAKGQVTVNGQVWTARSFSDDVLLDKDIKVKVEKISGVKLIVRPVEGGGISCHL